MRANAYILAISMSLAATGVSQAQRVLGPIPTEQTPMRAATPPGAAPSPSLLPPPAAAPVVDANCANPNAIGVARTVEIDTTGAPGFGFEHFKAYDFLRPGEVVLTFDDGPWPNSTAIVLQALATQCTKAVFFPIGKHSIWRPDILKQVAAGGHTIGSHTWSHVDLSKLPADQAVAEIERAMSAVRIAAGVPVAPFFRFPQLKHPPEIMAYLGNRNVAVFSTDFDSFDFKFRKPEQVVKSVMDKVKKHGKGIVLMHDNHTWTANAVTGILAELKAGGYKVVHMKAKEQLSTQPEYDDMVMKELNPSGVMARPMSSVIRTVGE